ncbi:heparinase II/III family protein [Kordiimonas sp.]|uniref:heparinase II/III family protein n=1 Tax=Kordiimonas sp. TaxID=1970157 RepID=UPI003A92B4E6
MNAAFDQIAEYAARSPMSRSTLRRDSGTPLVLTLLSRFGRTVREWGYTTSLYSHRLRGRHPGQLLGSPDDPAPGNATLGSAIFGGDMLFEGEQHALKEEFWIRLDSATPAFRRYAHSFHWLQDLAQVGDQIKARDAAETILGWWLPFGEDWFKEAWDAETLARRLINWLTHAPLILSADDLVYRSKVLTSFARQTRHLMRVWRDTEPGLPRVYSTAALTLCGLLLPGGASWLNRGAQELERTLKDFILPDGGPASRNTADAIRAMQLLILVRGAFQERGDDLPAWVQTTLDRIGPFVRAMRHGDGNFAQFGGVTAEGGHGTNAILAASEAKGKAIENAAHTGFQRIVAGKACLIVDAGPPPGGNYAARGHASTSAFEFSNGQERLIVSVGPASRRGPMPQLAKLARTTAAHSALVIGDRNSTRLMDDGRLGAGVAETLTIREVMEESVRLRTTHDGYLKRFGVKHERILELSGDGTRLKGSDRLFGPKLKKLSGQQVLLRFHLHPQVKALKAPDGRITLETRSGKTWIFDADGGNAEIEDSLYLSRPDRPEASKQIVVTLSKEGAQRGSGEGTNQPICNWVLSEMNI